MKKAAKLIALIATFCIMFTSIPLMSGDLNADAATNKLKLTAKAKSTTAIYLRWNKISKPQKGYAVFVNGQAYKHYGTRTTSCTVKGLKPGTEYSFHVITWKKVRAKMYYNTKTKKWLWFNPGKKYTSKTKYGMKTVYETWSPMVRCTTARAKYTIKYDANGGTGAPANGVKIQNKAYTVSKTVPAKKGYKFTGWTIVETGYKNLKPGGTISAKYNHSYTLKAQWVKDDTSGKDPASGDTGVQTSDGKSILNGDSKNVVCQNKWIKIYDDGHVAIANPGIQFLEDDDELSVWDGSGLGRIYYRKEMLKCIARGYVLAKEKNYYYNIKFLHQPYTNIGTTQFVETNDPRREDYSIIYDNSEGKQAQVGGINVFEITGGDVPVVDLGDYSGRGHTKKLTFYESGELTATITLKWMQNQLVNEGYDMNYRVFFAAGKGDKELEKTAGLEEPWEITKKIMVIDEDAEHEKWLDKVISENTDSSMTPREKVTAVNNYLKSIAIYPLNITNSDGKNILVNLAEEYGIPPYFNNRWDSYTSPYELVRIGKKVGYPLHSMYNDYEYGTEEWRNYHAYARSVDEPEVMYKFCPPSSTGHIDHYEMIDYDTWNYYEAY